MNAQLGPPGAPRDPDLATQPRRYPYMWMPRWLNKFRALRFVPLLSGLTLMSSSLLGLGTMPAALAAGNQVDLVAAGPATYTHLQPPQTCASTTFPNAEYGTGVNSLAPSTLTLGQIVPFEFKLTVDNAMATAGAATVVVQWDTETSSNKAFGYDAAYGLGCAFFDDTDLANTATGVTVATAAAAGPATAFTDSITVSGLTGQSTKVVIVELWVRLDLTVPANLGGTVHASVADAYVGPVGGGGAKIQTGNADVPLNKLQDFLKATATVATVIHDPGHNVVTAVPAGTVVHDSATVSGNQGTPTGTVSFYWYPPGVTCNNDGTNVGQATSSGSHALDGAGVAHPSASQTPATAGTYYFQAHFPGDGNYLEAYGPCEALTVNAATVATSIHTGTHTVTTSVVAGTTVHDSATVTGSGATPTGNVDFFWYPDGVTCAAGGTNSANATASGAGVVLDANGTAHPSTAQTPATVGTYAFQAHYLGSLTYPAAWGPCETLTVTAVAAVTPTVATTIHDGSHNVVTSVAVGTAVHDYATVSNSAVGNVDFFWYPDGVTCSAGGANSNAATAAGSVAVVAGIAHPSSTMTPATAGAYAFQAHFVSTDPAFNSAWGPCEPLTVFTPGFSAAYQPGHPGPVHDQDRAGAGARG